MRNFIFLIIIVPLLSSCSSTLEQLKRVGKAPPMSHVALPIDEDAVQDTITPAQRAAHTKRTNSLWQPGSTTFFKDNRAWKVGDILKVTVVIQDSANLNNSTSQARKSSDQSGLTSLFGKEKALAKTLGIPNTTSLISDSGARQYGGAGGITRKETINTQIAAIVTQVLPNGNLIIQGSQEVRVNTELREIKIAGVIRSKDIAADNSITSSQIAEARISYGGRGVVSDMQQPRIGSQIVDILSPF